MAVLNTELHEVVGASKAYSKSWMMIFPLGSRLSLARTQKRLGLASAIPEGLACVEPCGYLRKTYELELQAPLKNLMKPVQPFDEVRT